MKTNSTIKHILLAFTIALSMAACKKDKKDDPTPLPPEIKAITLTELKALSTGAAVKVPDNKKVMGVVISDVGSKNIDNKTIVLQEATTQAGIIITFDAAQTFAVGDQLEVEISNQTLAQVNGEVVLQNIPAANAKKTGTSAITAKATTIAEIGTNKAIWDGTLVTIPATELTGGNGKYTGALTIKDASGTLSSNVLAGAAFENTSYPISVSSITGIVRINGNDTRIDIRTTADVIIGAITRIVTDKFEDIKSILDRTDDDAYINYGLLTSVSSWPGQGQYNTITGKDYPADADFAEANRTYTFIGSVETPGTGLNLGYGGPISGTKNPGLKTVSITFAVTKAKSFPLWYFGTNTLDATVTAVQLAIQPKIININAQPNFTEILLADFEGNDKLITKSPTYASAGQFYTYTWTLPTNAELTAAGVSDADAKKFLENPGFSLYNISKSSGGGDYGSLMFFDKAVFGYSN